MLGRAERAAGPSEPSAWVAAMRTSKFGSLCIRKTSTGTALPNIDGVLRQPPYEPPINATPEQLDAAMKDGDYRRALRDARAKIGR